MIGLFFGMSFHLLTTLIPMPRAEAGCIIIIHNVMDLRGPGIIDGAVFQSALTLAIIFIIKGNDVMHNRQW